MHRGDVRMGDCGELDELRLQVGFVSEANESAFVAHLVAVVRRAEDGDALAVVLDDISLLLHLVRTNHKLEVIGSKEVFGNVRSEREPNSSLRWTSPKLRLRV
jgi:hypothetical protein